MNRLRRSTSTVIPSVVTDGVQSAPTVDRVEVDLDRWRGLRGHSLFAFFSFFLVIGAWSIAAPYNGMPDEMHHMFRAAGVVLGDLMPQPEAVVMGSGAYQTVPAGIVSDDRLCWQFKPTVSAACAPPPTTDRTLIKVGSGAGRYPPPYYAMVGWPLRQWPGWTGAILARLISAALSAALLAAALISVLRWSRHRLMLAGLVVACSPMLYHMAGAVNPSGLEIAAGVALFAAAIPLLLIPHREPPSMLIWLTGISAVLLAVLRASGPLWVSIAFASILLPIDRRYLRACWRSRLLRCWVVAIGAAMVLSIAWTEVMKAADLGDFRSGQHLSLSQAVIAEFGAWSGYLDQMVGVTSWLDTYVPSPLYRIWQFAAAALLLWALVLGHRDDRIRLLLVLAGGVLVPSALQVLYINVTGFITQGRYMLPVLVGIPLLSAWTLEQHGWFRDQARTLSRLLVVLLLPIHLIVLIFTMVRWQSGLPPMPKLSSLNPLAGSWHPLLGSITPLLAQCLGLLLVGWLVWSASSASGGGIRSMDSATNQMVT